MLGMAAPALADTPPVGGQFCAKDDIGKTAKDADGKLLKCVLKDGDEQPRWVPVDPGGDPGGEDPGGEDPGNENPPPTFTFGYDKVKLSSLRVAPGYKTTFTVTCPASVTITGNGYTRNPLPVTKAGENTWTATGTFRGKLPNPTTATVVCEGYGSVKYSTQPEKPGTKPGTPGQMTPKPPKIPNGRIDTGDGSTYMRNEGSNAGLLAAGWGALTAAGLGAIALRRRTVRERS
ncbi:hypothetical protein [Actinomadura monticuli]|uniref:LPXTG cell wall anchor domain-containing protein n=1 Tax=Actinomadura monticuli TaxID=3097367 RepID=A0ABV4QEB6_9ACTN